MEERGRTRVFLSSSIRWNYWNIFNNKQFSLTWMEKFLILLGIDRGGKNYLVSERKKNKGNNKRKGISFWLRESIEKLFLNLWKIGTGILLLTCENSCFDLMREHDRKISISFSSISFFVDGKQRGMVTIHLCPWYFLHASCFIDLSISIRNQIVLWNFERPNSPCDSLSVTRN